MEVPFFWGGFFCGGFFFFGFGLKSGGRSKGNFLFKFEKEVGGCVCFVQMLFPRIHVLYCTYAHIYEEEN